MVRLHKSSANRQSSQRHGMPSGGKEPVATPRGSSAASICHGFLVLHARSGTIVYSQRFSPAFGLTTCAGLASEELRLAAMLFALHLNAAACSASESTSGLTSYTLGSVTVQFRESTNHPLLFVLFAPAALGSAAAARLAGEVLQRFETCFASALQDPQTRQGTLKRATFASHLRDAIAALHEWCLGQAMDEASRVAPPAASSAPSTSSSSARLEVCSLATLHSAVICDALEDSRPDQLDAASSARAVTSSRSDAPLSPGTDTTTTSAGTGAKRTPRRSTSRQRAPPSPPPPPLHSLVGLPASLDAYSPRRRAGIGRLLCGCLPGHAMIIPRRPAPPPPMPLPLLAWRDAAPRPASPSGAAGSVAGAAAWWRAADAGGAADATTRQRLQHLVRELVGAWRHRAVLSAGTLYTPPSAEAEDDSRAGLAVVLTCRPMVLRLRVVIHRGVLSAAAAHDSWVAALVASLTAGMQPWLAPLALSLSALGKES